MPWPAPHVPWRDQVAAAAALRALAHDLVRSPDPWQVAWCAGSGVNGMTLPDADREVAQFEGFLDALSASEPSSAGAVFLASSAGGVWAGASPAPFTEESPVQPLAEYGRAKMRLERALDDVDVPGVSTLVGRLANIYGPGQDLGKQQGLVSHLCLGALERRPVSIFVPLDTLRDYVYVDDAAVKILASLDALRAAQVRSAVKIIGSGRAVTVATILSSVAAAAGTKPPIILGSSPLTAMQSRDLRLTSLVFPDVDAVPTTSLPAGIAATWSDLFSRFVTTGRRP